MNYFLNLTFFAIFASVFFTFICRKIFDIRSIGARVVVWTMFLVLAGLYFAFYSNIITSLSSPILLFVVPQIHNVHIAGIFIALANMIQLLISKGKRMIERV